MKYGHSEEFIRSLRYRRGKRACRFLLSGVTRTWPGLGHGVTIATGQLDAVRHMSTHGFEAIILDLKLTEGSAMAVANFASYRQPQAHIIAVTSDRCFSDGSIFAHLGNARFSGLFHEIDSCVEDALAIQIGQGFVKC